MLEIQLRTNGGFWVVGQMLEPQLSTNGDYDLWGQCWPKNMLADNSKVIFLYIKFILIMQKL